MTDDDYGKDRDPLLVRPYLLRDGEGSGANGSAADGSGQTWPAATTREVRSQRAFEGADDPTAIFELPVDPAAAPRAPRHARPARHRLLVRHRLPVLAGAGVMVLVGAATAGVLALRSDVRPPVSTALPVEALPPATGPALTTATTPAPTSAAPSKATAVATAAASARTSAAASAAVSPSAAASSPVAIGAPPAGDESPPAPEPPGAGLAPELPAGQVGAIRGQNGLCLALDGDLASSDGPLQVSGCATTPAQVWVVATDGTLRVAGRCALLVGDNTVHVTGCDGRTTTKWVISGQRVVSVASNGCLTDPSAGRTAGTRVTVVPCTGSAAQRWSLP